MNLIFGFVALLAYAAYAVNVCPRYEEWQHSEIGEIMEWNKCKTTNDPECINGRMCPERKCETPVEGDCCYANNCYCTYKKNDDYDKCAHENVCETEESKEERLTYSKGNTTEIVRKAWNKCQYKKDTQLDSECENGNRCPEKPCETPKRGVCCSDGLCKCIYEKRVNYTRCMQDHDDEVTRFRYLTTVIEDSVCSVGQKRMRNTYNVSLITTAVWKKNNPNNDILFDFEFDNMKLCPNSTIFMKPCQIPVKNGLCCNNDFCKCTYKDAENYDVCFNKTMDAVIDKVWDE